jgi:hypothetical protein
MTEYNDDVVDETTDGDGDDSVDSHPAEPVEETPDSDQAAEPVDNVGEVTGRRNPDIPTETPAPKHSS